MCHCPVPKLARLPPGPRLPQNIQRSLFPSVKRELLFKWEGQVSLEEGLPGRRGPGSREEAARLGGLFLADYASLQPGLETCLSPCSHCFSHVTRKRPALTALQGRCHAATPPPRPALGTGGRVQPADGRWHQLQAQFVNGIALLGHI